jgi:transcription initiation factor TFIIIB Brf1 subunit/transcription initiation factor TFIIB
MPRTKKVILDDLQLEEEEEEEEEKRRKLEEMKKRQRLIEAQKARERRANQTPEEIAGRGTE